MGNSETTELNAVTRVQAVFENVQRNLRSDGKSTGISSRSFAI